MITLWELKAGDGRRYSLFSWRARMALKHKGLEFETEPVFLTERAGARCTRTTSCSRCSSGRE
jgi:hypothetical protein